MCGSIFRLGTIVLYANSKINMYRLGQVVYFNNARTSSTPRIPAGPKKAFALLNGAIR